MPISGIPRSPLSAAAIVNASAKAIYKAVPTNIVETLRITGSTPAEVFKETIDFTDIDHLYYVYTTKDNGTGNNDTEIKIGGVSKVDNDNQSSDVVNQGGINCSAITGSQALTVEVNNTIGGISWIALLHFHTREA